MVADEDLVTNEGEEQRVDLSPKMCQFIDPLFGEDATFKVSFSIHAHICGAQTV